MRVALGVVQFNGRDVDFDASQFIHILDDQRQNTAKRCVCVTDEHCSRDIVLLYIRRSLILSLIHI